MSSYSANNSSFPIIGLTGLPEPEPTILPEPTIATLFIHRMDKNKSETEIKDIFKRMGLADVDRVDFVPLADNNKDRHKFHMAFVHMRKWYQTEHKRLTTHAKQIHDSINLDGKYNFMIPPFNNVDRRRPAPYWVLRKCHSPIPKAETDLTLEQLLEQNHIMATNAEVTAEKLSKLGDPLIAELNCAPPARMDNPVINIHQMATNNRLLALRKHKMEEKLTSYVEPFQFMQIDDLLV
jgi:hypothetical protein